LHIRRFHALFITNAVNLKERALRKPTIADFKSWHLAIAAQYSVGAVIYLVPIGFDHPSALGLDFNHIVLWGFGIVLFGLLSLVSVISAFADKSILGFMLAVAPFVGLYVTEWM
jgi:hypothetical protein